MSEPWLTLPPVKQWLALAWVIAFGVWGAPGCGAPGQTWRPMSQATARADLRHCRMIYSSTPMKPWTWGRICAATLHEWGHLKGRRHSTRPGTVMYRFLNGDRRCHRFGWLLRALPRLT